MYQNSDNPSQWPLLQLFELGRSFPYQQNVVFFTSFLFFEFQIIVLLGLLTQFQIRYLFSVAPSLFDCKLIKFDKLVTMLLFAGQRYSSFSKLESVTFTSLKH